MKGPRNGTLAFATKLVEVPRRTYSNEEISRMATQVDEARTKLAAIEKNGSEWDKYQAGARLRRFEDLLKKWKSPPDQTPLQVEIQALRIGEVALIAMPGEPFAEIGRGGSRQVAIPVHHVLRIFEWQGW